MTFVVKTATDSDAAEIAALRTRAETDLAERHGLRPSCVSEKSVLRGIASSRTLIATSGGAFVATLRLAVTKPWAIDLAYFTPMNRALYLHDLAVDPAQQRKGLGRALVEEAIEQARAWPAQAVRLDAYDAPHGAGGFYAKCGFREVGRVTYRKTPLIYYELML
jgi:GNAT superfamily N-acetyltransferase